MEAQRLVRQGYDRIAERHLAWAAQTRTEERRRYAQVLCDCLPPGARLLELGCGAGVPTTSRLADHFAVVGVDSSAHQLALARRHVPRAALLRADMADLALQRASVDAVAAFYSIIHVPRWQHFPLLTRIAAWLRPGGYFLASLGVTAQADIVEQDWLGVPMYFSGFDGRTNRRLVEAAGLRIVQAIEETAGEDGAPVTFLWVLAQK